MHAWAWDKLCMPEEEGGVALRRVADMNLAAGLKLVWRCCTLESIWAS